MIRITIKLNLLAFALATFFITAGFAPTVGYSKSAIPDFPAFYNPIQNGEADALRGVYVSNVLALPIVQQPDNDPYYVSSHDGEATQFSIASQYGNIGLLAHNDLSGKSFSKLSVGQEVELVYRDGGLRISLSQMSCVFRRYNPKAGRVHFSIWTILKPSQPIRCSIVSIRAAATSPSRLVSKQMGMRAGDAYSLWQRQKYNNPENLHCIPVSSYY